MKKKASAEKSSTSVSSFRLRPGSRSVIPAKDYAKVLFEENCRLRDERDELQVKNNRLRGAVAELISALALLAPVPDGVDDRCPF